MKETEMRGVTLSSCRIVPTQILSQTRLRGHCQPEGKSKTVTQDSKRKCLPVCPCGIVYAWPGLSLWCFQQIWLCDRDCSFFVAGYKKTHTHKSMLECAQAWMHRDGLLLCGQNEADIFWPSGDLGCSHSPKIIVTCLIVVLGRLYIKECWLSVSTVGSRDI